MQKRKEQAATLLEYALLATVFVVIFLFAMLQLRSASSTRGEKANEAIEEGVPPCGEANCW